MALHPTRKAKPSKAKRKMKPKARPRTSHRKK